LIRRLNKKGMIKNKEGEPKINYGDSIQKVSGDEKPE
jgi:hypothetical protein